MTLGRRMISALERKHRVAFLTEFGAFSVNHLRKARRLADEVLFLHHGRLVEYAPARTIFSNPQSKEAAIFLEGKLLW
jgi:ABC-type phosphate transport system ATPase subunit